MDRILFVDDDVEYGKTIGRLLTDNGYYTEVINDPFLALDIIIERDFDLVISDYKMGAIDGNRLLSYVKKMKPFTRTMLLTANPTRETELTSLDIQIDEFVRKEVHLDVLLKYVEKVLNTTNIETKRLNVLESKADNLKVLQEKREVFQGDVQVSLTQKEYDVLTFLMKNRGHIVSREDFLEELWDDLIADNDLRVVDNHIKTLRKKLNLISIKSIRGYGYKWNE